MIKPILQTAAISALAVGCMFYPFMPGTYDRMAVTPVFHIGSISGLTELTAGGPGARIRVSPTLTLR